MKNNKILSLLIITFIIFINPVFSKESKLAKETKKALSSYAGLSELKKRGFKLQELDNVESLDDVYNLLFPYMIQDGIPLDNAISFYDKNNYKTYDFKQHYTVHFTDEYGTKEKLQKKGYKENEIFAYFSKGQNVFRAGKFTWEKAKKNPELSQWIIPQLPPCVSEKVIYFWPAYYTDEFYTDYWEQSVNKDFIIFDMRLDQGGEYPITKFLDYLEEKNYQGLLIFIIDSSSYTGEWLLSFGMTKWQNGTERQRDLRYTSIGENTLGFQNFTGLWQRYENELSVFWGVQQQVNKAKKFDEGVGVMPDIWAENSSDIFKAVEYVTGIKDFEKYITVYKQFIENLKNQEDYNLYKFHLPESFRTINDEKTFMENFAKFVEAQTVIYKVCIDNSLKRPAIEAYLDMKFGYSVNSMTVSQYIGLLNKTIEDPLISNKERIVETKKEEKTVQPKKVIKKLSAKERDSLYKELEMTMVEIPGLNLKMLNTEVTQKFYTAIMGSNPSKNVGDNYPVENVSCFDAMYFCNKLSEKFGLTPVYSINHESDYEKWDYIPHSEPKEWVMKYNKKITQNKEADGFRLPYQSEWYYAAKGGKKYSYWAGHGDIDDVAWYSGNSGMHTHPVAQKRANNYGLYDMSGNVYEWTAEYSYWFTKLGGGCDSSLRGCCADNEAWLGRDYNAGMYDVTYTGFRIVIPAETSKTIKATPLEEMGIQMEEIPGKNIKMLATEVTEGLYKTILGIEIDYDWNKNENMAVSKVTWYDAIYFCNKLSEKLKLTPVYAVGGKTDVRKWNYSPNKQEKIQGEITQNTDANGFRLPTLEEWQYAAKGGKNFIYSGSNDLDLVACGRLSNEPCRVACLIPNRYGLYDMSGNVWEWVWDATDENHHYLCGGDVYDYDETRRIDSKKEFDAAVIPKYSYTYPGFRFVCSSSVR